MVKKVELFSLEIPFKFGYDHAQASRLKTQSMILRLTDQNGIIGYGETAPRTYVSGETYTIIHDLLNDHITVLKNFDGNDDSIVEIVNSLPDKQTAASCLLETALIHLGSQMKHQSLEEFCGISFKGPQTYSATLTGGKREEFLLAAHMFHQNKMKFVKIKLVDDTAENIWRISYIHDLYQGEAAIRIDGNEIWEFDRNKQDIQALINAGITRFEQPFHKNDVRSVQKFHAEFSNHASVILDDAIITSADLDKWVSSGGLSGINIKIAKNGGLNRSIQLAKKALEHDLDIQLGCHVGETSLLSGIGALFASAFGNEILYAEGGFSDHLLVEDIFNPPVKFGYKGVINSIPAKLDCTVDLNGYPYAHLIATWTL